MYENSGYIQSTDFQVQCHPVLQLKMLKEKRLKGVDWEDVIPKINKGKLPKWMPVLMVETLDTTPKMPSEEFDVVSPRSTSDLGRIFGEKMKWLAPFVTLKPTME